MRLVTLLVAALASAATWGQPANPVYTDDSPAAADTLARATQLVNSGNRSEAARALQRLLEEDADRVIASAADADLFESVRARVHRTLVESPDLLAEYRILSGPQAATLLAGGDVEHVEHAFLMTEAGFEAALRLGQQHVEAARFDAAFMTLAQLEQHPDRQGAGARDAAASLAAAAAYLNRPEVWEVAGRWSREGGLAEPQRTPSPRPPAADKRAYSPILGGESAPGLGIPARPLWSLDLGSGSQGPAPVGFGPAVAPQAGRAGAALWVLPTAVGNMIVANDGVWIRGVDRFTLEPRWQVRPEPAPGIGEDAEARIRQERLQRSLQFTVEDACTVTVAGSLGLSVTGLALRGEREGDPRLHAFDLETGRVRWSVLVSQLDSRLQFSSVRGAVLVSGDTAVVSLRKAVPTQRIVTQYLVGLDLWTGSLRWVRHVGSAGSLPFNRDRRMADTPAMDLGVAYTLDQLGVCGAFEAHTGRPVWVRRTASIELGNAQSSLPWESNGPVVFDDRIAVLGADRRDILLLDRATGEIRERRSADAFGEPWYLLRCGGCLVAVGHDALGAVPLDRFQERDAVRVSGRIGAGIQGRVVASGGALVAPTSTGLVVIDPATPAAGVSIALERSGVALPLGDQVVVADDTALHSYLTWEAADSLLAERMAQSPDDPRPAVAAADLAFRAGRHERIASAADLALRAIERAPDLPVNAAARQRLFEALLEMLRAEIPQGLGQPGPLPLAVQDEVVNRLELSAATPGQRVAAAFTLGRLREEQRRPGDAVAALQRVLSDGALAETMWAGSSQAVRAHAEASRRLWEIVRRDGVGVYADFNARAHAEAGLLGPTPGVEELEGLARRYPVAEATPRLWLRAADAHEVAGAPRSAVAALYAALYSAEMLGAARPLQAPPELGEAAGRLVLALEQADRVAAASQVLTAIRSRHPALALSARGLPINTEALAATLAARLGAVARFPRIGATVVGDPQAIAGWTLMSPLSRSGAWLARDHVVMINQARAMVALWGQDSGLDEEPSGPDRLQLLWSRPFRERPPVLLRNDPDAVFLFWPAAEGAVIERIDTVGGRTRWETAPFTRLFAPDDAFERGLLGPDGRAIRFDTPVDGSARVTDMVVSVGDSVIALVERSGRAAFIDADTGRILRTITAPIGAVFDVDSADGRVVIAGAAQAPAGDLGVLAATPMTLCYDARSGEELLRLAPGEGQVRWVRLGGEGLIVAYDTDITCTEVTTGRTLWRMGAAAPFRSLDAWLFGERLFILNEDRQLFAASARDGSVRDGAIDTRDHFETLSRVDAFGIGDRFAFSTARGLMLLSAAGDVVGMDAFEDETLMLPPAPSERVFVAIETVAREVEPGRPGFSVHFLGAGDASLLSTQRVVLWDTPSAIATLDGRIVVTAGNVTTVYPVPAGQGP